MPRPFVLGFLLVLFVAGAATFGLRGCSDDRRSGTAPVVPTPPGTPARPIPDPFGYKPDDEAKFVKRAALGTAHPLYTLSPGGAIATAERVARWREQVEDAARAIDVDPDTLEGLVFLESAGRSDAIAGDADDAVGLTQILAETGQNLLGMRVDVAASSKLTRAIGRARRRGDEAKAERLKRERRKVDERYDPARALAGTARYMRLALKRFGREDLAFVSYHMGMGNLSDVLADYGAGKTSYARVYFDSTPRSKPAVVRRLLALGDDSSTYLWRVYAAREIMRLYRDDRDELERRARLQTSKASSEELLHPPRDTQRFVDADQLRRAWEDGTIKAFPDDPMTTGLTRDRKMGELSEDPSLYRGLRPPALALALYLGAQTRAYNGDRGTLRVTSTVRDKAYQAQLVRSNRQATRNYSLHTTGWAFDIARDYSSQRQALQFQFVLDRLAVLDVIAWTREPGAIHITASADGEALTDLLDRID